MSNDTGYPLQRLFRERLVPLMQMGHRIRVAGVSFWVEASGKLACDHRVYEWPDAAFRHMAELVEGAPRGWIEVDGVKWIPCRQVDAIIVKLHTNTSMVPNAWRTNCTGETLT